MKRELSVKLWQSATVLLCIIVIWRYGAKLQGTEFSAGSVTGTLLSMKEVGALLLVLTLPLTYRYRRFAAALAIGASLLCLPLFVYLTAPVLSRWLFVGEYSAARPRNFVWNNWGIAGITSLALVTFVGIRSVISRATPEARV
jgi:hypothetical protein